MKHPENDIVLTDVLIIGSGIAGLSVALKVAQHFPDRSICILSKGLSNESNTWHAQGGIAVVSDWLNDSFEEHIQDTFNAGDGLCDAEVVKKVISEAPDRLHELIQMGVAFDRTPDGELRLAREGGHRVNRIVHCKDETGTNVVTTLLKRIKSSPNITMLTNHLATELITGVDDENTAAEGITCYGAQVLNVIECSVKKYISRFTVVATGGIGQLYHVNTNPLIATGDGIAMAYRAGARVSNMEFVQFHPTALAEPETNPAFLISEAVRGFGAYLRNEKGERFMFNHHEDGELACRDVVARAMVTELQASGEKSVFLDCTHIAGKFPEYFPAIYNKCISKGLDPGLKGIPVVPAAHYLCGGIETDMHARTNIRNLYACGECANTGLHGANRLASNSLLEAMVFAHTCYLDISKNLPDLFIPPNFRAHKHEPLPSNSDSSYLLAIKSALQQLMTGHAGIVRTTKGLQYVREEVYAMKQTITDLKSSYFFSPQWYELRNMTDVALLIIDQSLKRKENLGVFFNSDLAYEQITGQAFPANS